jgi:hypothetical protein
MMTELLPEYEARMRTTHLPWAGWWEAAKTCAKVHSDSRLEGLRKTEKRFRIGDFLAEFVTFQRQRRA